MVVCPQGPQLHGTLPSPLAYASSPQAFDPTDRRGAGVGLTQALRPLSLCPKAALASGSGVTSVGQQPLGALLTPLAEPRPRPVKAGG